MNLTEKQMDVLDRFLRNEMTEADGKMWQEMMNDSAVQDEIRNISHLQQMIKQEGRERLRAELKSWDLEETMYRKGGRMRWISPLSLVAAAAVALIVISILVFRMVDGEQGDLFATYYEPYPNVVAPIQKGNVQLSEYEIAFQLYESKKYSDALSAFQTLPQSDPAVIFYQGLSSIETGDYARARTFFGQLSQLGQHDFLEASEWYLALLEYQSGDNTRSLLMIERIAGNPAHLFHKKAILLKKEMDR